MVGSLIGLAIGLAIRLLSVRDILGVILPVLGRDLPSRRGIAAILRGIAPLPLRLFPVPHGRGRSHIGMIIILHIKSFLTRRGQFNSI